MSDYSDGFRARMVRRMAGPEGISATRLSDEVGVSQPTLSRWLREAGNLEGMKNKHKKNKRSQQSKPKSPRQWTVQEKIRVVLEAADLSDEELGAFLRSKGLHSAIR